MKDNFNSQFNLEKNYYLKKLDFLDWYRYFFIIKEIINLKPKNILEIGSGSGIVKNCLQSITESYKTFDINPKLKPDFLGDIREYKKDLEKQFDCIIVADVLEHIPSKDLEKTLKNLGNYLIDAGKIIITLPHRASHFLFMTPTYIPHIFRIPTGFCSPGAFYRRFIKRKIWIDPNHCWEIGDGKHTMENVEKVMKKAGLKIEKRKKLLYVDFWVLKKII